MTRHVSYSAVRVGSYESFYVGGGLKSYLVDADKVEILTLESFVARANQGKL